VWRGIPILYAGSRPPDDLVYASPDPEQTGLGRIRALLRGLGLEGLARRLWHAYLAIDARATPGSPATPDFWVDRIKSALPTTRRRVLDLGGGAGSYRPVLARSEDAYLILEVDGASPSVRKGSSRHAYVIGDGHLPIFGEGCFDVIAMFEVLEHVRNPFQLFANCARWLAPDGRLVLSTPQYWHIHGWPNDYFRYTIHGLRELARTAGLEMIDSWPMGGPCVLIWSAIELNFAPILRFPVIRQLVAYPALWLARVADHLFFSNNLTRANPDTRGWMAVFAQKSR
jgi:SAM-dependent methyltransferase